MARTRLLVTALGVCALLASAANETLAGTVSYSYVSDQSSYFVTYGQTVTVSIYLQETITSGASSIINGDGGLYNAAVKLSTPNGQTNYVANATSGATNNAGPPGKGFSPNIGSAGASGSGVANMGYIYNLSYTNAAFPTSGPGSGPTSSSTIGTTTTNLYFLGSFTFTAGNTSGTTVYDLDPYSGKGSNTTTWGSVSGSGYDLDVSGTAGGQAYTGAASNPTQFTITVAAVPEPSSVLLCGLATCGMGFRAWRKRKAKLQSELAGSIA